MKPVLVLTVVGFCSAVLLAMVNEVTKMSIKAAVEKVKIDAVKQTFPFEIDKIKVVMEEDSTFFEIPGKRNKLRGVAVETFTDKGYGGRVNVLVAISPDCKIFDYRVLSHKETPGLGDNITKESFRKQFNGKTLNGINWKVKKDGGFVDELTAATISSRGITGAILKSLKLFSNKYKGRCR